MMENKKLTDDELIMMFFEDNRVELPDDGFSKRVMAQLPSRMVKLSRLWTAACWVVGIVAFIVFKGWHQLGLLFQNAWGNLVGALSSMDLITVSPAIIWMSLMILVSLAFYELVRSEA
ncbi:MAG: DUF5056 domain-containing protein [Prevotella sp.]|nr:DUF5056 domain-containing protein [Prevotella sp.]